MKPHPTKQPSENLEVLLEVLPAHKDPAGSSIWEKYAEIRGAKFGNAAMYVMKHCSMHG